jgi:hypothetical protein
MARPCIEDKPLVAVAIRLSLEDYNRLKEEAAGRKQSFAQHVRNLLSK